MDRLKAQSIGDVIKEFMTERKGPDFIDELRVINSWKSIVGAYISAHTLDLHIKNGILMVCLDSDALRNEMNYSKTLLLKNINEMVGRNLLKDIVLR